jgi:hypothetical protein
MTRSARGSGILALPALLLVGAATLAACGGDDDEPSRGEATVVTEAKGGPGPPARREEEPPEKADDGESGPPPGRRGGGEPDKAPKPPPRGPVQATGPSLERLVETVLGRTTVDGGRRVLSARCKAGRCRIVYVSDVPGGGKILEDQRGIWRKLYSNRQIRQTTLVVRSGPKDTAGGGKEIPPSLTITCRRSALRDIDWNRAPAAALASACRLR